MEWPSSLVWPMWQCSIQHLLGPHESNPAPCKGKDPSCAPRAYLMGILQRSICCSRFQPNAFCGRKSWCKAVDSLPTNAASTSNEYRTEARTMFEVSNCCCTGWTDHPFHIQIQQLRSQLLHHAWKRTPGMLGRITNIVTIPDDCWLYLSKQRACHQLIYTTTTKQ